MELNLKYIYYQVDYFVRKSATYRFYDWETDSIQ